MNVALLEQIADVIVQKPDQFDTRSWHNTTPRSTTHCIAGWAQALTDFKISYCTTSIDAQFALRISEKQCNILFYPHNWPHGFCDEEAMERDQATAEQAAARIRHFIATEGRE